MSGDVVQTAARAVKFNLRCQPSALLKPVAEPERHETSFISTNDSTAFLLIIKETQIRCSRQRRAAWRLYSHRVKRMIRLYREKHSFCCNKGKKSSFWEKKKNNHHKGALKSQWSTALVILPTYSSSLKSLATLDLVVRVLFF